MAEEKEKLLRLVNSSGFPFQLRIADQIRRQDPMFGWELLAQETPWRAEGGREGFIDIVIRNRRENDRMVLECKRTREADWVFLLPQDGESDKGTRARMLYVDVPLDQSADELRMGWHNFYTHPESTISEFCIVRGTGEGHRPMLENLCGVLLDSAECLAREESSVAIERKTSLCCSYIPVIVTNANLQVCRFELSSISLDDGEIPDGEFESVPYIRFSKTLSTRGISDVPITTLGAATRERQRTVFVVQASQLEMFLKDWYIPNTRENQRPWN